MKTLLEEFKSDILNAIFKVSGKVWLKVTSAYAIQTIILTLLVTFFIIGNLGANFSTEIMQDPEALKSFMEEMMSSEIPANLITNLFLLMGVGIILGSWLLNFSLLITDSHIKEGKVDFGKTIGNSFNKNILTIAGTLILIGLIFTGGFVITGMVSGISGILGFLTGMAVCILIFKFILIIPALVLGKKSYGNAVSFSFQHITYTRCLKLFGITILVF